MILFTVLVSGQTIRPANAALNRHTIQRILGFESEDGTSLPSGWSGGPSGTIAAEGRIVHSGKWSARLQRQGDSSGSFSALTAVLPQDFTGEEIQLSGFLRLEGVSDFAGMWMREDGDGQVLAFTNMQSQHLQGTEDWRQYTIKLPVKPGATVLNIGVLLSGTGTVWADDLQLLVDGKPVAEAAEAPQEAPTVLDTDHEFDGGSRTAFDSLTENQIDNLATLGRVWGFLKYHHPMVTSGKRQWDYDLFRIMPAILASKTSAEASGVLAGWIANLGVVADCTSCIHLDLNAVELKPDMGWIGDRATLGAPLSDRLQRIYANRSDKGQFYVALDKAVGNPSFKHELSYEAVKFPDAGFQLLCLFRFWNMMQYWAPYRDNAHEDWPQVLKEFIPKVALAKDKDAYQLATMALIARAHDTHANLWSALALRPPTGACSLPVETRFIDNKAVVTGYTEKDVEKSSDLKIGDTLEALDGVPVAKLIERWTPLYADSNKAARLRDIARHLTQGNCGPATIRIRREEQVLDVDLIRMPMGGMTFSTTHDLPGDTFRFLSKDVAYLKLSSVRSADLPHSIELAKSTKGLIVDIRNYPSEFVVFALGSLLATKHTPFATFTVGDTANPGAFHFVESVALAPAAPHYGGKVVILVDEESQSQAEYTAMAFRATPNAIVVGSTTAGADGNTSAIPLPGGLNTMISGIGIYYPDKRPTQRVGIQPDVEAKPTLAGVKAGRDEVLETGIRQILGAGASSAEIQKMACP